MLIFSDTVASFTNFTARLRDEKGKTLVTVIQETSENETVFELQTYASPPASSLRISLDGTAVLRLCRVETFGGKVTIIWLYVRVFGGMLYVSCISQLTFPRFCSVK